MPLAVFFCLLRIMQLASSASSLLRRRILPEEWAVAFLAVCACISALIAGSPQALNGLIDIGIVWVAYRAASHTGLWRLPVSGVAWLAGGIAAIAVLEAAFSHLHLPERARVLTDEFIRGGFASHTGFASMLLLVVPPAIALSLGSWPQRSALALAGVGMLGLVMAESRGAWAAAVVSAAAWFVVKPVRIRTIVRMLPIIIGMLIAAGLAIRLTGAGTAFVPDLERLRWDLILEDRRWINWTTAANVFLAYPWTGAGPDLYAYAAYDLRPGGTMWLMDKPFNHLMLIAAEIGLPGLVGALTAAACVLRRAVCVMRSESEPAVNKGFALALMASMAHALWEYNYSISVLALGAGIWAGILNRAANENRPEADPRTFRSRSFVWALSLSALLAAGVVMRGMADHRVWLEGRRSDRPVVTLQHKVDDLAAAVGIWPVDQRPMVVSARLRLQRASIELNRSAAVRWAGSAKEDLLRLAGSHDHYDWLYLGIAEASILMNGDVTREAIGWLELLIQERPQSYRAHARAAALVFRYLKPIEKNTEFEAWAQRQTAASLKGAVGDWRIPVAFMRRYWSYSTTGRSSEDRMTAFLRQHDVTLDDMIEAARLSGYLSVLERLTRERDV